MKSIYTVAYTILKDVTNQIIFHKCLEPNKCFKKSAFAYSYRENKN